MAISLAVRKQPSELNVSKGGFRVVVGFEGLHLQSYPDPGSRLGIELDRLRRAAKRMDLTYKDVPDWETKPGDPWTIGYGRAHGVKEGDTCTLSQADAWLTEDLETAAAKVRAEIQVSLTQDEFDALVSLVYNLGYIPKSMKACLNGGVTDKGREMAAGSYGEALKQFPRNCRAAGVPMRGLLRRRLAEACVFSGLPWEAACSINLVRLTLDAKGDPDPDGTTSLEDTLIRARMDIPDKPIQRPDVSDAMKAPWPTTTTIITDQPASSMRVDDKGGEAPVIPNPPVASPAPSQKPAATVSGPVAGPAVEPKAAPSVSPPTHPGNAPVPKVTFPKDEPKVAAAPPAVVVAGQDGTKPKSPNTTLPADVPYKIDPNAGLKPLEESDRAKGYVVQQVGISIIRLGSLGVFGTTIQAGAQTVQGDPVLSNMLLIGFCAAGVAVVGWVVKVYGDWKRKRGNERASQGLF